MSAALRRKAALVVGGVLLSGGVALAVWVAVSGDSEDSKPVLIDERAGLLRGVRFGDTAVEIRARLGEPTDEEPGFFLAGTDFTGPPAIPSPASDARSRVPPENLHYGDTAYLVSPTAGVYSMAIQDDAARTRAGIGIGDELGEVRRRYDRVDCGEAIAGEPLFGDDYPTYPWCRAIVGDVRVFFGEDPIESVTLTRLVGIRRGRPVRSSPRRRRPRRAPARPREFAPGRGRR